MGKKDQECLSFDNLLYNYWRYHNNTVNCLIHIVFIPWIYYTFGIMIAHITPMMTVMDYTFNPAIIAVNGAFCVVYLMVDRVTGLCFSACNIPETILCWVAVQHTTEVEALTGYSTWQLAVGINIFGWLAQFVGHGVFESKLDTQILSVITTICIERAPAIIDNLSYALLAPFFQMFEVLHYFGYKEGKDLDDLMKRIDKDIE